MRGELARAAPGRQTPGVAVAFRTRERRMGKITDVAERFWSGDLSPTDRHPWAALHELEELDTGIAFVSTFANVTAVETGAGLVLVDTGSAPFAGQLHAGTERGGPSRIARDLGGRVLRWRARREGWRRLDDGRICRGGPGR